MARPPDLERRQELLDQIVVYLADHGLAQATLRPMASALGVSTNRLVHHFGVKDELIVAALARAIDLQIAVQGRWLARNPTMPQVELYAKWWRWMNAKPDHLALVRLNYEAAALDPSVTGLTGAVRADQIGVWRHDVGERLRSEGVAPDLVEFEAGLAKATFSGFVMDLLATGDRSRVTRAFHQWLERLQASIDAAKR